MLCQAAPGLTLADSLAPATGIPLKQFVTDPSTGLAKQLLSALHINNKEETVVWIASFQI
jgi:hypothetical protein